MIKLLDKELEKIAKGLVKEGKVILSDDAFKDIQKNNYSEEFLKKNFECGVLISGKELYDKKPEYHNRNYCISCYSKEGPFRVLGKRYNLISWNFTDDFKKLIIFIHTSPCGGYEKKVYKEALKIKGLSP